MKFKMRKAIRLAFLCLIGIMSYSVSQAQGWKRSSSLEFGIMLGGSNYQGDLVASGFETRGTHFNGGVIVRYNPVQRFTFRLGANYGHISGDDRWYSGDPDRAFRNLHFKSVLWDVHAGFDINLNTFEFKQQKGVIPYLTFGVAVFKFNPQAEFTYDPNSWQATELQNYASLEDRDGEIVDLQPLGTEGQQTTEYNELSWYSLTQVSIPVGVGVKFRLNKRWGIGVEYVPRITFTDHLDDVSGAYVEPVYTESQYGAISPSMSDRSVSRNEAGTLRGSDDGNDRYAIFGFNITYRIFPGKEKCFQF